MKTSYKQYSIFTYQDQDILCEPYIVKKDDWLYKIFRQKGEISEQNFPLFITIFKEINPRIHNIDTISPGIQILIPLQTVNRQAYSLDDKGMVEVPVVQFSDISEPPVLAPHIREHIIQAKDTVSDLLDKAFLQKGGGVTPEGRQLFYRLNPDIKNIHVIYQGTKVTIPESSILSQPWFPSFLAQGRTTTASRAKQPSGSTHVAASAPEPPETIQKISPYQIRQLEQYAALLKGTLVHQGKMYFPSKEDATHFFLDLSQTPLIETHGHDEKILLIPGGRAGAVLDRQLILTIKSHWHQLKTEEIASAIQKIGLQTRQPVSLSVIQHHMTDILSSPSIMYIPEEKIAFFVNDIAMSATFGRVKRPGQLDLLINFGNVYGTAISTIQDMGFEVVSFFPDLSWKHQIQQLLSSLGYSTWKNPSFSHQKTVETLQGLYGELPPDRLFISPYPLTPGAETFLKHEQIRYIHLKE
ncbi:MAG: hypothetical protein LC660_11710 [Desulfobacteraceae bacterium]|nr:hypothetical protein [Desulfobacteraceae bacterium]